ncbi:MAG TPA: hypothetical protein VG942_16580 [Hyphomonadaceae bacterium]|nr:hypothetical protein [Hyphomonadaceae bacterium]
MAFSIRRQLPGGAEDPIEFAHPDDTPTVVTFGTDRGNTIRVDVTDPNERVNARHCTLVYTGAGFRIDFERDTRVFIGDSPTPTLGLSDPFVHSGDSKEIKLRLGMPVAAASGGAASASRNPVFYISRDDAGAADLKNLKPGAQHSNDPIERIKEGDRGRRRQAVFAGLLAVAMLVIGVGLFALATRVDQHEKWAQDMQAGLSQSVGVIGVARIENGREVSFEPTGTGWLCCADAGKSASPVLITNYHVWAASSGLVQRTGGSARIVIHFPDGAAAAPLSDRQIVLQDIGAKTEIRSHPLYGAFATFLTNNQLADAAPNVYDVISIPIIGSPKAMEGRPLLSLAQPRGAPQGTEPVAAIGYPIENLPYALNYDSPVPKFYPSNIVRRTSPFLGPAAHGVPSLLALQAESAGGLSGSPVIAGEKGSFHVVGLVMQASLMAAKPEPPKEPLSTQPQVSPPHPGTTGPAPAVDSSVDDATYAPGRRFATSNVVFATDSETIRELFAPPDQQRLSDAEAGDAWKLSRKNQFREPMAASFEALTSMHGCEGLALKDPAATPNLSDNIARDARAGEGSSGLAALKRIGGYKLTEKFGADELVWIAATYDKAHDAPLELDVREGGSASAEKDADAFMVVPGFSSYLWTGAPKAGSLDVSVRGEQGAKVKIYVQHCMPGQTQAGAPDGQH